MESLKDNAELLSALATALMTIAWVVYAQFAILTYIRQRRPRVVIDQTEDRSINTKFVVVNLSEQPVYVSCVMVVVRRGEEEETHKISTYRQPSPDDGDDTGLESVADQLRHGTLSSGQLLMLGSSEETLSWLLSDDADDVDDSRYTRIRRALREVDWFEIRVVSMAGVDDRPVACKRTFRIEKLEEDGVEITPMYSYTEQYTTWRQRRIAEEWAEYCVTN